MIINTKQYNVRAYEEEVSSSGQSWKCSIYRENKKIGWASSGDKNTISIHLPEDDKVKLLEIFSRIDTTEKYPEYNLGNIIMVLCDNAQTVSYLKSIYREKTIWQLKSTNLFYILDVAYDQELSDVIISKHAEDIEFIFNDSFPKHGFNVGKYFEQINR